MPELPDLVVDVEALQNRTVGRRLEQVLVKSPFLLRTVEPDLTEALGLTVENLHRLGKRIVIAFPGELFLVFHLMIAGRFHWKKRKTSPRSKHDLAISRQGNRLS